MKTIRSQLQSIWANLNASRLGFLTSGRIRTSTVGITLVLLAAWWAYDTYQHSTAATSDPNQPPVTQVVPPGFVPDPSYTWVPRARLQQPPVTITETATPPPITITETAPPEPPPPTNAPGGPFPRPPNEPAPETPPSKPGMPPLQLPPPLGPPPPAPEPPPPTPAQPPA